MKNITKAIDKYTQLILDAQDYIWKNAETGYREVKTTAYMGEIFEALGYDVKYADGITGFYTTIDTGKEGPTVLILGELDSLICREHPDAAEGTGAVHCCGHSAQCAALVGIAACLKEEGVADGLCGKIMLCAVPAEELIEIEYRDELMRQGKIKYYGGKPEFMHRGYFDGVDIAFMVHTAGGDKIDIRRGSIGCIAKRITYKGKSAHAGGAPWSGVNALYAATNGLNAANALRETFKDSDCIRFHPIITAGGNAVNAIPDKVVIESYVRGMTFDAIKQANQRINRALTGAALSIGANVDITDKAGYAPHRNSTEMMELARDAAEAIGEPYSYSENIGTGCTDMGDLSVVMPVVHPYAYGAVGTSHGSDYYIADPMKACVMSAKWQLVMLKLLLENEGARAKTVIDSFDPPFKSIKEYLEYIDSLESSGDRITYTDDGATVRL